MLKDRAVENVAPTFTKDSHPKVLSYYQQPEKNA